MTNRVTNLHAQSPTTFSSLLLVNECLLDEQRTNAFRTAIQQAVRPGDIVLDAGTGSGILALFAAEAGAAKVYAVEVDQEVLATVTRNIPSAAPFDAIQVVHADLMEFITPESIDVVIMEMLDTGLIAEMQAPALNALRTNGVIGPRTRVVPQAVHCSVDLLEYDFDFYGFTMPHVIQARNRGAEGRVRRLLSEQVLYRTVDFCSWIPITVDASRTIRVNNSGTLNAIRLKTRTVLTDDTALWETSDMNMPVIIPVDPLTVTEGDEFTLTIRYAMGGGFSGVVVKIDS